MKETEMSAEIFDTAAVSGLDEAAGLRKISEMIRDDMLRYGRPLDAEEEMDEN